MTYHRGTSYTRTSLNSWCVIWTFVFMFTCCMCRGLGVDEDGLMSDVHLEHYYVIEENILSNADILLRDDYFGADEEEDEEDHSAHAPDLTEFQSLINETKSIHRKAGPNLQHFLAHPINVYHLFRRLNTRWRDGLDLLLMTSPCKKWKVPSIVARLQYFKDILPGDDEIESVVALTARLQRIHNYSASDVSEGKLGDLMSLRPLDQEEQHDFVKILQDQEDTSTALLWLKHIDTVMTQSNNDMTPNINRTCVLLMMASAQFHLKNLQGAVDATQQALHLDPKSSTAGSNLVYFKEKLAHQDSENITTVLSTRPRSKYERLCARVKSSKVSRLSCTLSRVGLTFFKTEILRRKPFIVLFHDVIRNTTVVDVLKNYAFKTQTDEAWVDEEKYVKPTFSVGLSERKLRSKVIVQAARNVRTQLKMLSEVVNVSSTHSGTPQVVNIGLDGISFAKHEMAFKQFKKFREHKGTLYLFLNEVTTGGEVIYKRQGLSLPVTKGSVLFSPASIQSSHRHCPVLGSSMWVAVQPLYNTKISQCDHEDE